MTNRQTIARPDAVYTALLVGASFAAAEPIDPVRAKQYFDEAAQLCAADGGRLWGMSLCGPMLLAERDSRRVVANQADADGFLGAKMGVFGAVLPEEVMIANTATEWAGTRWTMLAWPLPADERDRGQLMMHELWHRVQSDLGLAMDDPANAHLDTLDGRVYMQLEWRALATALGKAGVDQVRAVKDALVFRAARRALIKGSAAEENALEINEGLAEYTGIRLSGCQNVECRKRAIQQLERAPQAQSFVRSFAYATGPAWGLLLDQTDLEWRTRLTKDTDLGALAARAMNIRFTQPLAEAYRAAAPRYDADALRAVERRRFEDRRAKLEALKVSFLEGPVLTLPLRNMRFRFDPGTVVPLAEDAVYYPDARISDSWGTLEAPGGFLIKDEMTRVVVPVSADLSDPPTRGNGWSLSLRSGWQIVRDEREGCWTGRRSR